MHRSPSALNFEKGWREVGPSTFEELGRRRTTIAPMVGTIEPNNFILVLRMRMLSEPFRLYEQKQLFGWFSGYPPVAYFSQLWNIGVCTGDNPLISIGP